MEQMDENRADQATLRRRVVEAAARLGWGRESVGCFAKALTGQSWEECAEAELREVLEEYEALIRVVEEKMARNARAADGNSPGSVASHGLGTERRPR